MMNWPAKAKNTPRQKISSECCPQRIAGRRYGDFSQGQSRGMKCTVTVRFVPRDWPGLKSPILQPAIRCGQHSLEIFCLGVFLAFAGQFVISEYSGGPLIQVAISLAGILIMIGTASLISWYKAIEGRSPGSRVKSPDADLAGGEA